MKQESQGKRHVYGTRKADTMCNISEQFLNFPKLLYPLQGIHETALWTSDSAIRLQKSFLGQTSRDVVILTAAPKKDCKKIQVISSMFSDHSGNNSKSITEIFLENSQMLKTTLHTSKLRASGKKLTITLGRFCDLLLKQLSGRAYV